MTKTTAMEAGFCARGIMIVLALPVGALADVYGLGWVTFVSGLIQAVAALPLYAALVAFPTDPAVVMLYYGLGLALVGSMAGTVFFCFAVELFPTAVRGVGVGIAYNLGFALFGGLAPVLAELLSDSSPLAPAALLVVGGLITSGSVILGLELQRRGLLCVAHVRPVPYFAGWSEWKPLAAMIGGGGDGGGRTLGEEPAGQKRLEEVIGAKDAIRFDDVRVELTGEDRSNSVPEHSGDEASAAESAPVLEEVKKRAQAHGSNGGHRSPKSDESEKGRTEVCRAVQDDLVSVAATRGRTLECRAGPLSWICGCSPGSPRSARSLSLY